MYIRAGLIAAFFIAGPAELALKSAALAPAGWCAAALNS